MICLRRTVLEAINEQSSGPFHWPLISIRSNLDIFFITITVLSGDDNKIFNLSQPETNHLPVSGLSISAAVDPACLRPTRRTRIRHGKNRTRFFHYFSS